MFLTLVVSETIAKSLMPKSMPTPSVEGCFDCLPTNFNPLMGFSLREPLIPTESHQFSPSKDIRGLVYFAWVGILPFSASFIQLSLWRFFFLLPAIFSSLTCVSVKSSRQNRISPSAPHRTERAVFPHSAPRIIFNTRYSLKPEAL